MFGWNLNFWETLLLLIGAIVSSIIVFPCWLLQKVGFKAKWYSKLIYKWQLDELSFFRVENYTN